MIKINKFLIPYIIFLMILGFKGNMLIAFILAVLHELVHYIVAASMGYKSSDIEILPIGTVLRFKDLEHISIRENLIICSSAPILNILVGIFFCAIKIKYDNYFIDCMINGNLSIGLFNLIPAFPLDGGRILKEILLKNKTQKNATKIETIVSVTIGIVILFIYLFLCSIGKWENVNLVVISIFIIITSLKENERTPYIIMGDIVKKKTSFIKSGYMENAMISVYCETKLIKVLSLVEKNRYNIFTVLDMEMHLMGIIYEEDIINALKEYGNISFKELICIKNQNK